jgi:hypothetical protein
MFVCSKHSFLAKYTLFVSSKKFVRKFNLISFVTLHPLFPMLLYRSPGHRNSRSASWRQMLQGKIQDWVRQQIINDDPFDEEPLQAQLLYEELQKLELARVTVPFQSESKLRKPHGLSARL